MKISHWKGSTRVVQEFKMCYEHFQSAKLLHSAYLSQIF